MPGLIVNIDVPDLGEAERFYTAALGLTAARRLGNWGLELLGAGVPICLIAQAAGSPPAPRVPPRRYDRHWTPIHPDFIVTDLEAAIARAAAAGAVPQGGIATEGYGRFATFADPFGHGFCLIEFTPEGYDAVVA